MKKLIYAIASVTALAAHVDAASAGVLTQGADGKKNLYDDYIEPPKVEPVKEVLVASAGPLVIDVAPEVEAAPEPAAQTYEYKVDQPGVSKRVAVAPLNNSNSVVAKSAPDAAVRRQVPEPSVVMGMLAIAAATAAVRRKNEISGEAPLS